MLTDGFFTQRPSTRRSFLPQAVTTGRSTHLPRTSLWLGRHFGAGSTITLGSFGWAALVWPGSTWGTGAS